MAIASKQVNNNLNFEHRLANHISVCIVYIQMISRTSSLQLGWSIELRRATDKERYKKIMDKLSEDSDCRLLADDSGNGGVVAEKPATDANPDVPKGQPDFGHWTPYIVLCWKLETCSAAAACSAADYC